MNNLLLNKKKIFNFKNFLILIILFFCYSIKNSNAAISKIKFIVIGHLYPIMEKPKIVDKLYSKITSLNPDYIFVLGDSKLNDPEVIKSWRNKFGPKVFFSPGNNEIINGNLNKYKEIVGYTEKIIERDDIRFLLGNSNTDAIDLKRFINEATFNKSYKKNILLLHHRIWDDTLTSAKPYQHDKSYYLKEIFSTLENNIDTIFAGNSKHQYFFDQKKTNGNQNMNLIYWVDRISDINAYSIGTGLGIPKLGFVEVIHIRNKPLIIIPHHIMNELKEPIPIENIIHSKNSIKPEKYRSSLEFKIRKFIKDFYNNKRNYLIAFSYIFLGTVIGCLSSLLYLNRNNL